MLSQAKTADPVKYPILKFRTFNVGCLPAHLEYINRGEFNNKTNLQRAEAIANDILAGNFDVVCLQEVWDNEVLDLLKLKLGSTFPYIAHEGLITLPNLVFYRYLMGLDKDVYNHEPLKEKLEIIFNPSGLVFFSKLKPLEERKHTFNHKLLGEETFGQKEFRAIKFLVEPNGFITYIGTHFPAGGAIFESIQEPVFGTTSYIRSQASDQIYAAVLKNNWHLTPPPQTQLQHLATLLGGDMNDCYNNCREWYRVSIGGSAVNDFNKGDVKYLKGLELAHCFDFVSPNNWMEIREDAPAKRGAGKQIDPVKEQKAEEEHKMTGTDLGHAPPPTNIIDVLTIAKNPNNPNGALITTIVSSNGNSDHNAVNGVLDLNVPRIPRTNIYDTYTLVATGRADPSCGWLNRILGAPPVYHMVRKDQAEVKEKNKDSKKFSLQSFFANLFKPSAKPAVAEKTSQQVLKR